MTVVNPWKKQPKRGQEFTDNNELKVDQEWVSTEDKQDDTIAQLVLAVDRLTNILGNQTDGDQKTQLIDAAWNVTHSTQDINGMWHTGVHVIQHNLVSDSNSSETNLTANWEEWDEFVGISESTNWAWLIIVMLKADKNCTVYIEQSIDGTNWDVSDSFDYTDFVDNFSTSVQVVWQFFRTRVVNEIASATTYFRLQSQISPIGNSLPRKLDDEWHLEVCVRGLKDEYWFEAENTPAGELRVAPVTLLVWAAFEGTVLDPNFWTPTVANDGTAAVVDGDLTISTKTTANWSSSVYSVRRARDVPWASLRARLTVNVNNTGVANNVRTWGIANWASMPTITDGAYFKLNGTTFSVEVIDGGTPVNVTSFNGRLGSTYELDTDVHEYEIYYVARTVYFTIDGKLLHTYSITENSWSATMEHHLHFNTVNSNGATTGNSIVIHSAWIARLWELKSQPTFGYQSGTTAWVVFKYGAWDLHELLISWVSQNSVVTLFDNTAASGKIIWSSGAMWAQTRPLSMDFAWVWFSNGLTLLITGASSNVTVIYE